MTQFTIPGKIFQSIPETTPSQNHPSKTQKKSRSTPPLRRNTAGLYPPEPYTGASKNSETTE